MENRKKQILIVDVVEEILIFLQTLLEDEGVNPNIQREESV